MSLYTKYRPKDWDSVIGQESISRVLRNSLRKDSVGHAYIFTGARGTGKTTSARILAKGVNCQSLQDGNPCHACANCIAFDNGSFLDVIEIDGASNNGVENVRELIEKSRFEPSQGKYKIYIIDEIHMLSTGAFNALLKTLEEPPPHVKFILATTEIDKVPETIRSRALEFDFKKITEKDIITRLEFVTESEGIKADPGALQILAKAARGGLRDALTLLEQNTIDGTLEKEYVEATLSLLEESLIENIIESLRNADKQSVQDAIGLLQTRHVRVRGFFDQMLYALRDKMVAHLDTNEFHTYEAIFGIFESAYGHIRSFPDGFLLIEITLLRALKRHTAGMPESRTGGLKEEKTVKYETIIPKTPEKKEITPVTKLEEPKAQKMEASEEDTIPVTETFSYPKLLNALKEKKASLVAELKMARFTLKGTHLTLTFSKKWNYDRINTPNTKGLVTEVVESLFGGGSWVVECELADGNHHHEILEEVF